MKYMTHGTSNCYSGPLKCRCEPCVEAKRQERQAYRAMAKAGRWPDQQCVECGVTFDPNPRRTGRIPNRCVPCREANRLRNRGTEIGAVVCYTCGGTFLGSKNHAYCQDICKLVGQKIRQRIRSQRRREQRKCARHGTQGFCDKCHALNFNKNATRKRGYTGERISALRLAESQRWKCSLCEGSLDTQWASPHPLSISIDHTIPRSLGGTDDPANLTAAHLACNVRKSNKSLGPEQLRLVA